jgi:rare lipoprotein A (peptidoglycan hydrolase)
MMKNGICLFIFLSSILTGFGQQDTLPITNKPANIVDTLRPNAFKVAGKAITGNATTYNLDFDGSRTASGETFSNIRLTAASNDFKLNSWVKVTNPKNKKYVLLRINDRLSSAQRKKGVAINLSAEAGKNIGIKKGISLKVKIELIDILDSLSVSRIEDSIKLANTSQKDSLSPNSFKVIGKAVTGIASFYSYNLDGTLTATGERYRNKLLTAASNHFKLNTWVLVTNLRNKKSVIVRINDRMHPRMKKKGRVVDLSREAARLLDFMDNGLTKVKVQPVKFVYTPPVQQTDSLRIPADSLKLTDSLSTDSLKTENSYITGIASFYSKSFDGRKTANGEIFRNKKLSAASNDFDLNTWVRVTNMDNGKSVVLKINDRMHPRMQKKGRVVDLSRLAAQKLDFIKKGLTNVKVEVVDEGTLN